jgi:hypothetical protein
MNEPPLRRIPTARARHDLVPNLVKQKQNVDAGLFQMLQKGPSV